jgi:hypothetical protein
VAGGYSYDLNFGQKKAGQVYGLLEARLKVTEQFDEDYQLAAGTQLGWLYSGSQWQMNAFTSYLPAVLGEEFDYHDFSISLGSKLSRNLQLRLEAQRQLISSHGTYTDGDNIKLGLNWYF